MAFRIGFNPQFHPLKDPNYVGKTELKAFASSPPQGRNYKGFMMPKSKRVSRKPIPVKKKATLAGIYRAAGSFTQNKYVRAAGGMAASYVASKAGESFEEFSKAALATAGKRAMRLGAKRMADLLELPTCNVHSSKVAKDMMAALTERNDKSLPSNGLMNTRRLLRTKWETGKPTSKAIRMAAKLNGTNKVVLYDTKQTDDTTPGSQLTRGQMTASHGFNSAGYQCLSTRSYVNYEDLRVSIAVANTDVFASNQDQRVYASIMNTKSELQFFNQSADFPIILKIHCIDLKGESSEGATEDFLASFATRIFNNTLTSQREGCVPILLQHSDVETENLTGNRISTTAQLDVSYKMRGMESSPFFRENFKLVKTHTQMLLPSDTWQFTHVHHMGGGFDVAPLTITDGDLSQQIFTRQPVPYFYVIESQGIPCEIAYRSLTGNRLEQWLGKSPGYYALEHRKSITYAQADSDGTDLNNLGIGVLPACHIRVFSNPQFVAAQPRLREFNLGVTSIVNKVSSDLLAGEGSIPIQVDYIGRYAKTTSGAAEAAPVGP